MWDWPEVADWLFERGTLSREDVVEARVVKEANCCLSPERSRAEGDRRSTVGGVGVAGDGFARRLEALEEVQAAHVSARHCTPLSP